MFRAVVLAWCGLLLAPALQARLGVVETRDGHVYEGQIRFDSNLVVVANAVKELLVFVDLTNLAELTFHDERRPEIPTREGSLPAVWQDEDIGSVRLPGQVAARENLFRIKSSGTNIFGESDSFHFVYKAVKGDSEMVARVLQVQYTVPWAKAGLMMREGLGADARNVFLAVTPMRLGVFQWREARGDVTEGEAQRDMFVSSWIRLRREGNTFTASKSWNGRQWSLAGRITIPMREDIFVGMAVAGTREPATERGPFQLNRSILDGVREAPFLLNDSFLPVIQLQSGSTVTGRILSADDRQIQLTGTPLPSPVSASSVARILFRWLPYGLAAKIRSSRPGVLLNTGEFVEGDFKGIERGQVRISSVLLGLRTFDLNNDLTALVLRKPLTVPHLYEIKTIDGSVWVGAALHIENDHFVLQEGSLGDWKIPFHEVIELRRKANTG